MQNIDNPLANNYPHNNFNHLLAIMLIVDTRILKSQIPYVNLLRTKTASYVLLIFFLDNLKKYRNRFTRRLRSSPFRKGSMPFSRHLKTPLCHRPGGAWLFARFLTKIHQFHPEFFTREANDFLKFNHSCIYMQNCVTRYLR